MPAVKNTLQIAGPSLTPYQVLNLIQTKIISQIKVVLQIKNDLNNQDVLIILVDFIGLGCDNNKLSQPITLPDQSKTPFFYRI